MAFKAEFCRDVCPWRGSCPDANELWLASVGTPRWDKSMRVEGMVGHWEGTFVGEDGQEQVGRTPDVYLMCTPANGQQFTKQEEWQVGAKAAELFEDCSGPRPKRFLWLPLPIMVCGAVKGAAGERAKIKMKLEPALDQTAEHHSSEGLEDTELPGEAA